MKALIINCSPVRDGATAEITNIIAAELSRKYETKQVCIDDYSIAYCKGCRSCHNTAKCVITDGAQQLMAEFEAADVIICAAPSYWADVPGQFKAFIDRCTPYSNTHEPHASLSAGKKGYAVVLRTGPNMKECERLIQTIEHFYGHLEIQCCGHIGFCSVENRQALLHRADELKEFCKEI
ncbi:MAG: flavodoxin family protein [Ruminococcus sp.]|jgi:multimeric flavodoxin WrbA|nr:flavodoxin family protein [Ruminococcus sp.]MBR7008997.1 flavodoxin family protein [Ruminococcus sp.]